MSLEWKTQPKPYQSLIQCEREYVVHARGFTIGNDLWLDEYSLYLEHHRYWNDRVRKHYNYPEWEGGTRWTYYSATNIDEPNIYWSINGNSMFIVQYPRLQQLDQERFDLVMETLDELSAPDDICVSFVPAGKDVSSTNSHAKSIINPNYTTRKIEYGEIDGIESVKY